MRTFLVAAKRRSSAALHYTPSLLFKSDAESGGEISVRFFGFSRQIFYVGSFQPFPRILAEKSEVLTVISTADSW